MPICSACGGTIIHCEHVGPGGADLFSLCCDVLPCWIDNQEVMEGLPAYLVRAIEGAEREERKAIKARNIAEAARFKLWRDYAFKTWPHLFHGEHNVI